MAETIPGLSQQRLLPAPGAARDREKTSRQAGRLFGWDLEGITLPPPKYGSHKEDCQSFGLGLNNRGAGCRLVQYMLFLAWMNVSYSLYLPDTLCRIIFQTSNSDSSGSGCFGSMCLFCRTDSGGDEVSDRSLACRTSSVGKADQWLFASQFRRARVTMVGA